MSVDRFDFVLKSVELFLLLRVEGFPLLRSGIHDFPLRGLFGRALLAESSNLCFVTHDLSPCRSNRMDLVDDKRCPVAGRDIQLDHRN